MDSGLKELSAYRFARSMEELDNARAVLKDGRFKMAMNRSYYAIFHAMRAVNILDGFDSSKHSGVIAHFNQFYVKSGTFPKEISKIIHNASEMREQADYNDFFIAYKQDAVEQIDKAAYLIDIIENLLKVRGVILK